MGHSYLHPILVLREFLDGSLPILGRNQGTAGDGEDGVDNVLGLIDRDVSVEPGSIQAKEGAEEVCDERSEEMSEANRKRVALMGVVNGWSRRSCPFFAHSHLATCAQPSPCLKGTAGTSLQHT